MRDEWNNFNSGIWVKEINVRDFIQKNYTPYEGDDSFLCDATQNTKDLWAQVMELTKEERERVVFLIWIPTSFLLSLPTALAI